MNRIAVIGRTDSIDYFRVIGCETFHTGDDLEEDRLIEILGKGFAIVFVTEEIFSRSGELLRRAVKGPLPVVCVPPLMYGFGDFKIFSGIWKDTVLPASNATSIGCPGGFPASITLTVWGTVSWMETISSRKLPLTPAPIGSLL